MQHVIRQRAQPRSIFVEACVWIHFLRNPYLVVDVWSRKVVALDVTEVESAQISADLVQRACIKDALPPPQQLCQKPVPPADIYPPCQHTPMQFVEPLWNQGWRRWEYSDPYLGQGSQTTTPTQSPCSERSRTRLTTPAGTLPARTMPANG